MGVNITKNGIVYVSGIQPKPNLVHDSELMSIDKWVYGSFATRKIAPDGSVYVELNGTADSWNSVVMSPRVAPYVMNYSDVRNKQITISLEMKASKDNFSQYVTFGLSKQGTIARTNYISFYQPVLTQEWRYYYYTLTLQDSTFTGGTGTPEATDGLYIQVYNHVNDVTVWVRRIKLEVNNEPTGWCMNKNDPEYIMGHTNFIEGSPESAMKLYDGYIMPHEFVEW